MSYTAPPPPEGFPAPPTATPDPATPDPAVSPPATLPDPAVPSAPATAPLPTSNPEVPVLDPTTPPAPVAVADPAVPLEDRVKTLEGRVDKLSAAAAPGDSGGPNPGGLGAPDVTGLPILGPGSDGPAVAELARLLEAAGHETSISRGENPHGIVDDTVIAAVRRFRATVEVDEVEVPGSNPDTVIGPATWAALLAQDK